ncbi:MAG: hypothetical protein HN389_09870 [Clostridia bacterium]|nr:hypothetical protein [Clostridia bacterium]
MDKRERITTALKGGVPDVVPYMYNTVTKEIQERIIGEQISEPTITGLNMTGWLGGMDETPQIFPILSTVPKVAQFLGMDAIQIQVVPPLFVEHVIANDEACVSAGLLTSPGALQKAKLPDPDDEQLMRSIADLIDRYKGDFALGVRVRLGASSTIMSMGMEAIAYSMADEDGLLQGVVQMYTSWSKRLLKNLCEMDFDFVWAFDDIAYTTGMMFSPKVFRDYFKEGLRNAASAISKPWIFHSDGDYSLVLDDIIEIGANAIHPIEKESMDFSWLKANYGDKLCLVGNLDIDYTLSKGTVEEVDAEVKARIDELGVGGGYIIADSNSIPNFCKAENVIAMSKAVHKYRGIY